MGMTERGTEQLLSPRRGPVSGGRCGHAEAVSASGLQKASCLLPYFQPQCQEVAKLYTYMVDTDQKKSEEAVANGGNEWWGPASLVLCGALLDILEVDSCLARTALGPS